MLEALNAIGEQKETYVFFDRGILIQRLGSSQCPLQCVRCFDWAPPSNTGAIERLYKFFARTSKFCPAAA